VASFATKTDPTINQRRGDIMNRNKRRITTILSTFLALTAAYPALGGFVC
jgi:hypothetical protein